MSGGTRQVLRATVFGTDSALASARCCVANIVGFGVAGRGVIR